MQEFFLSCARFFSFDENKIGFGDFALVKDIKTIDSKFQDEEVKRIFGSYYLNSLNQFPCFLKK